MKIICRNCKKTLTVGRATARSGKWENLTLEIEPCENCAKKAKK